MLEALVGEQHPLTRKSFLKFSATSALLAAGCGSTSTGSATKGATSQKQLLVALSGGPATLDPQTTIAGTDWISLANIYDGLFMRDYTSSALPIPTIPGLATSYRVSGDGRTYTFTLRTGVTFHDGSAWDADAALFNFRRMFDKSFHYYYPLANSTVSPFIGGIADYDAPDSHTLRIQLTKANAGWFDYLTAAPTFFMVSPAAVMKLGNNGLANHGVGTGPFLVKEYVRDTRLVLAANPNFWGGKPSIAELVIAPVPDDSARVSGMLSGQYQIAESIPPESIAQVSSAQGLSLKFAGKPVTFGFGGDTRHGPWSDPKVRQAVSLAIDRQGISQRILHGAGVPASQFYGLGNQARDPSLQPLPYSLAQAKSVLASSSYPKGLHFNFATSTSAMGVPNPSLILEEIQSNLEGIGITSSIKVSEWTTYLGFWAKGTPPAQGDVVPIYTQAMGWDTNMLLGSYVASASQPPNGVNFVWYSDKSVDQSLGAGQAASSPSGLISDLRQAQRTMLADQPYIFVFHGRVPFAVQRGVTWAPANAWAQRFSRASVSA